MRSIARRALPLLTLALVVAGTVGCASGGGSGKTGGSRPTGHLMEPDAARKIGYVVNWAQDLQVRDRLSHARVLGDVVVTVQQPSNVVSAVDARTGDVRWRRVVGNESDRLRAPGRFGDQVLVATDDRLYRLRVTDGDVLGVDTLEGITTGAPLVVNNIAVFGTIDGTILGHDLNAGYATWRYKLTDRVLVTPVLVGNYAFATDARGTYAMLNPTDGTLIWRGRTFGAISAPPASDQANVYVPSNDRTLYTLNRGTGRDQWVYRANQALTLPPSVYDNLVLLPLPGDGVLAFEAVDGNKRWTSEVRGLPITRRDDAVLLADSDSFWLVRLEDGQTLAEASSLRLKDALEGPEGSLILVAPNGRVLRLNAAK